MSSESYPARCDCKPGTVENGWREERGASCHEVELAAWSRMLENFKIWRQS
jgi:hypothetical protein